MDAKNRFDPGWDEKEISDRGVSCWVKPIVTRNTSAELSDIGWVSAQKCPSP